MQEQVQMQGRGSEGMDPPPPLAHDVGYLILDPKLPPPIFVHVDLSWTPPPLRNPTSGVVQWFTMKGTLAWDYAWKCANIMYEELYVTYMDWWLNHGQVCKSCVMSQSLDLIATATPVMFWVLRIKLPSLYSHSSRWELSCLKCVKEWYIINLWRYQLYLYLMSYDKITLDNILADWDYICLDIVLSVFIPIPLET